MFTGIVEKLGRIENIITSARGGRLEISGDFTDWHDLELGESISVNGVCLTLVGFSENTLSFDISPETVSRTSFRYLSGKDIVNLERALRLSDRLGGHIVLGHVDDVAEVVSIKGEKNFYTFGFKVSRHIKRFLPEKASVSVDGISLTVATVRGDVIEIAVIPHTYDNTNLKYKRVGDKVNIEVDVIARYVDSLLGERRLEGKGISLSFLSEHGFI